MEVVTDNAQAVIALRYPLERVPDEWEIPEVPVPESVAHDKLVAYLVALLSAWAERQARRVLVARNLAVRWVKDRPRVGIDPDVAVIDPEPPNLRQLESLKLWEAGCKPPRLAIEVVSRHHPYKDYSVLPERYASMGVGELWVLDPGRHGPRRLGGPHFVQQFTRDGDGTLVRTYAGDGPVYSETVGAWVRAASDLGVELSDDAAGKQRWLTAQAAEAAARIEATQRAARLAQKLRELGVDPDRL